MSITLSSGVPLSNIFEILIQGYFGPMCRQRFSLCGRMILCLWLSLWFSAWTFCRLVRPISPRWLDGCNCSLSLSLIVLREKTVGPSGLRSYGPRSQDALYHVRSARQRGIMLLHVWV
jgi:hypothetical protein